MTTGQCTHRQNSGWFVGDTSLIPFFGHPAPTNADFGGNIFEREVLEVASSAGILNDDVFKVFKNRLDQRNSAAHPSTLCVTQVQAEGFIDDLIRNAVLQLKI